MRFILLHYHIFKNAGSTIEENLEHSFHEKFLRFDTPDRNGKLDHANLLACLNAHPQVSAVSSHQIHYPVPQAPGILFFDLCFLRDPIDRIRSIYDYFRQKPSPGDPMSDLANHRPRGAFVRHLIENLPWTVSDVQVNLLAHGQVSDLARGPEDLQLATSRMLETSFLGVVDLFRESLIAGRHALRVIFPNLVCAHPPVNVSKGLRGTPEQRSREFREDCGDRLYRELLRRNEMDFELLRMARDEVQRRFELVPDCGERIQGEERSSNSRLRTAR